MFNTIVFLAILTIPIYMLFFSIYMLFFSKTSFATMELKKLNSILEEFNKTKNILLAKKKFNRINWKYNKEYVDLTRIIIDTFYNLSRKGRK